MSWESRKLGDLCWIEKGATGIQKAIPGAYPLVVTSEERKSHNEYQFDGEAVIIPLVSSTGHGHKSLKRIHFQTGKFALGSILCAVIPKDKTILDAEYLYRYLDLKKEEELVSRMKGMANVTLPIKEIAQIEIPVPPIEEQRKFVDAYGVLEGTNSELSIELTYQQDLVKQVRQAFLREAIQGKLVKQDKKDGLAKDLLAKIRAEKAKSGKKEKPLPPIKEEEIPFEIPENWVWCRLGEICKFTNGKAHEQFIDENGKYILVTSRFVSTSGKTIKRTSALLTPLFEKDIAIVMSDVPEGRALGRCYLIQENDTYTLNQRIGGISSSEIDSKYLCYALDRNQYFLNFDDGKKQTNLRKDQILSCPIPLPPLAEQKRIVKKLEELMKLGDDLQTSIEASQEQNEMLLQQVLREALEVKGKEYKAPKEKLSLTAEE